MQTQFWKKLPTRIYFLSFEKLSRIVIVLLVIFCLGLLAHFLLNLGLSTSLNLANCILVINLMMIIALYQYHQSIKT
ncbi:MAG: hypothetical protein ACKPJ4_05635, partial [Dolichospermum sp.]